jgi:sarcosine oxidase
MAADATADVIVIGLGAFGSATACQLARRGARVLGIDRHVPPHAFGSSHGATRITRLAIGEGEVYVPFVRRSHALWRELEAATGTSLYQATGGLVMGRPDAASSHLHKPDFVRRTIDAARHHGIVHELLDAAAIRERFPQFAVDDDVLGYYEPEAGVLRPEACIAAQLDEARRLRARLVTSERVVAIEAAPGGVAVRTERGRYAAARAVVTAGAWVPGLVGGPWARRLRVMRQVLHWFRPADPTPYAAGRMPVFIWMHGRGDDDSMYGFPMVDGHPGVKVATEQYRDDTDPDAMAVAVSPEETQAMFERHVRGRLPGLTPQCVHAAACLYTVSEDAGFVIDRHPSLEHVTVVSACSGHGFKHSAAIGEALARRLCGDDDGSLRAFTLDRFADV